MTRRAVVITPDGWPCRYVDAPPGPIMVAEQLCFKSQYRTNLGQIEGYNSAGEYLCIEDGETVQPVRAEWREIEE